MSIFSKWRHRIDYVPKIGQPVEIRVMGTIHKAKTVPAWDRAFNGIGCDVGYVCDANGQRWSARNVEYWRYDR